MQFRFVCCNKLQNSIKILPSSLSKNVSIPVCIGLRLLKTLHKMECWIEENDCIRGAFSSFRTTSLHTAIIWTACIVALYGGVLTWNRKKKEYEVYYNYRTSRDTCNVAQYRVFLSFDAMRTKIFLNGYNNLKTSSICISIIGRFLRKKYARRYGVYSKNNEHFF